jgi:hypothetical protein
MVRQAYEEPSVIRVASMTPAEPMASWLLESTRQEAVEARRTVNDLYSRFPDERNRMYTALHSRNDVHLLSALDELLIHDLLIRQYRVEYEEDEGTAPDFRLYDADGGHVGTVEVVTLFQREDWAAEEKRHARLASDLNARLPLTTHSVEVEILSWNTTPRQRELTRWLQDAIDDLRTNPSALPFDEFDTPEKVYVTSAVEIAFRFLALPENYVIQEHDEIVLAGTSVGGAVDSAVRLRERLDDKAVKYDLRGKPFAIVIGVRDPMCDFNQVHQALTGTPAVVIATGNGIRKGDGFFGTGRLRTAGKHQRVSAVFSIHGWNPGGSYQPQIMRYDNPFAATPFPIPALPFCGHWGEIERDSTHVKADWLVPPAADARDERGG